MLKKLYRKIFPEVLKDVWYNAPVHTSGKQYTVFDENGNYIPCKMGLNISFKNGKIYEVTNIKEDRPWSDWLYQSDCIKCDLKRVS